MSRPSGAAPVRASDVGRSFGHTANTTLRFAKTWLYEKPLGLDLDPKRPGGVPFLADRDGASMFLTLAGFALVQGGALAAVAKGEGKDTIVLILYALAVALTIACIIRMLRSLREADDEPPLQEGKGHVRAYNRATIACGRWTLCWTVLLAIVLAGLAQLQLLPNQTRRQAYVDKEEIPIEPNFVDSDLRLFVNQGESTSTQQMQRSWMNKWFEWMAKGRAVNPNLTNPPSGRPAPKSVFLLLRQTVAFKDYYKDFPITLHSDLQGVSFSESVAFLVKGDDTWPYRPVYRALPFQPDKTGQNPSLTIRVVDADRGERLYVLTTVRVPAEIQLPRAPAGYGLKLLPNREELQ